MKLSPQFIVLKETPVRKLSAFLVEKTNFLIISILPLRRMGNYWEFSCFHIMKFLRSYIIMLNTHKLIIYIFKIKLSVYILVAKLNTSPSFGK